MDQKPVAPNPENPYASPLAIGEDKRGDGTPSLSLWRRIPSLCLIALGVILLLGTLAGFVPGTEVRTGGPWQVAVNVGFALLLLWTGVSIRR